MNIIVLAGGTSTEREVSISSGEQVTKALRSLGHAAILVDVCFGAPDLDPQTAFSNPCALEAAVAYMNSRTKDVKTVKTRRSFFGDGVLALCQEADAVFMALHGANGEDGKIQAAFELLGIPYTGSSHLGSALAMDKEISKEIFRGRGIPTPAGICVRKGEAILPVMENSIGVPCVVKPSCGGSSVGVCIAHTQEEYEAALEEGFAYEDVLIVEQYICGREFSVGVVDGEVYPVIEIAPLAGFYNYQNKYTAGSTIETCPANITQEEADRMQQCALDVYKALRLSSYARMDILMAETGEIFCLEANTLPGMTPTSLLPQEAAAIGLDYAHLCEKLIAVSLK